MKKKSGVILCFSAAIKDLHGVRFQIKNNLENIILEFKPINKRLAYITLQINNERTYKIIQVYAPTSESS